MGERYTGKLRDPIKVGLNTSNEEIVTAYFEKLEELCRLHGIEDTADKWFSLAIALVDAPPVPGLRLKKAAMPSWMPTRYTARHLMLYIELAKVEFAGGSVKEAAGHLSKREGPFKGRSAEGLRQQYVHLKNPNKPETKRMWALIAMLVNQPDKKL